MWLIGTTEILASALCLQRLVFCSRNWHRSFAMNYLSIEMHSLVLFDGNIMALIYISDCGVHSIISPMSNIFDFFHPANCPGPPPLGATIIHRTDQFYGGLYRL